VQKILVSACLLGHPVRYSGSGARCLDPILERWVAEGRVVSFCPEVAGGLPTPRPRAEIDGPGGGHSVLDGRSRVKTETGVDVTPAFQLGARQAVDLAAILGIRVAILKDESPSCGTTAIHDGTFRGVRIPGRGVTSARLEAGGVHVFTEGQLEDAAAVVEMLENL
jgi:uncharacterized protein YbbK (DUF523 family)